MATNLESGYGGTLKKMNFGGGLSVSKRLKSNRSTLLPRTPTPLCRKMHFGFRLFPQHQKCEVASVSELSRHKIANYRCRNEVFSNVFVALWHVRYDLLAHDAE